MRISSLAALSAAAIFQHAIAADSAGPIWYQDTDGGDTIGPRGAQGSSSDGMLVLVNQSYFLEAYRRPNATMAVAFDLAGQEGWRWR